MDQLQKLWPEMFQTVLDTIEAWTAKIGIFLIQLYKAALLSYLKKNTLKMFLMKFKIIEAVRAQYTEVGKETCREIKISIIFRKKNCLWYFVDFIPVLFSHWVLSQLSPFYPYLHSIFFIRKLSLLQHLGYLVALMHLGLSCFVCGAISFSSLKAAVKMTVYFRILGVLEFRE